MIERMEDETLKAQLQYEWLRIHLLCLTSSAPEAHPLYPE